jgi:pimeloyl-ACP methyl ester carboxylesterase
MSQPRALTFGPFVLDPVSGQLARDGVAVPLTPRAMQVLEYLARRPGRLVSKPELLGAAWAGTYVGDGALKVCIREIRRALGDDAKRPAYVETAHRRGYRFIAHVEQQASDVSDALPEVAEPLPLEGHQAAPPVKYARSGDVNIAYQVVGHGPLDLVFVMGWVSHLEYFWLEPRFSRFLTRLASFTRLILIDKRGTGLSDRVSELPSLEQRMEDVHAVMDAVGSRRAALMGVSEGGPMCSLFAATYPEKTAALVMVGSYARRLRDSDYPWGPTPAEHERFCDVILREWGGPVGIEQRAPGLAADETFRAWWATYLRMGASPGAAVALTRMNAQVDIRPVLAAIRVPTLVIHRTGDRCLLVEEGRYLASRIPGARFVELPGDDHLPFAGDQDAVLDAIEAFLAGVEHPSDDSRVLATVLWAEGDGETLAGEVTREVVKFRGQLVRAGATSFAAVFDGPARAIRAATSLAAAASRAGRTLAIGVHTGECELSPVGAAGPAVETARELAGLAPAGEVLVSRTVTDLVAGAGLHFEPAAVADDAAVRAPRPWSFARVAAESV